MHIEISSNDPVEEKQEEMQKGPNAALEEKETTAESEKCASSVVQLSHGTGGDCAAETNGPTALSLQKDVAAVRDSLLKVAEELYGINPAVQQLIETAGRAIRVRGLTRLAEFCRDLEADDDGNVSRLAPTLAFILQYDLGLDVLLPAPGDGFDPVRHERSDCTPEGRFVRRVVFGGWESGGTVLLKALVETDG